MCHLEKEIKEIQEKLNFYPSKENLKKFIDYLEYLLEYNKKINLTSFKSLKDLLKFQAFDFYPLLNIPLKEYCFDVGAGAGFLTVPLSIFLDKKIFALEPNRKRAFFLNMVKFKLNLNFEIFERRLEESLDILPEKGGDFLIKALPKKEKILKILSKRAKFPHRLIYFAGKNYEDIKKDLKICYSFKEMIKSPLRDSSFILIFENVSCETWEG